MVFAGNQRGEAATAPSAKPALESKPCIQEELPPRCDSSNSPRNCRTVAIAGTPRSTARLAASFPFYYYCCYYY
jgi:hypothetical protein